MKRSRSSARGAALLVVITSIAVLTALAVDVAYDTRVALQTAVNARDELRATALAQSAVGLSRLVLHFQADLDAATAGAGSALPPALTAALSQAGGGAGALSGLLGGRLSVRLWNLIPVDSSSAQLFLGGRPKPAAAGAARPASPPAEAGAAGPGAESGRAPPAARAFGDVEGAFFADIEDEDRKINVRQLDGLGLFPAAQALRLAQLIRDPRWDFLFDEDDANGLRVSRAELIAALRDWQDLDETSSVYTFDATKPFQSGYGDENALYDRLPQRVKAKNAPFDSHLELAMVAGVSDAFLAAFGDRLTVYPDVQAAINVNTDDPQQLLVNALLMSSPPGVPQPPLADPAFLEKLRSVLALVRPLPFMSLSPQAFASALQSLGVKIDPLYLQAQNTDARSPFGDRSSTFHIHAEGVAGDVHRTLDVVVTFDRRAEALARDLGRVLHWHEE